MLISLGGLVFSSVDTNGISKIQKVRKGEYSELKLVDGAMPQRTGRPLDKLTLSAQWVGLDAKSRTADLDVLLTGHHQMSDQDGNNMGAWTVDTLDVGGSGVFGEGFVCYDVKISLSEYR